MFSQLPEYTGDPILSLQQVYQNDVRPDKVNLGIGVYQDELGRIPTLECVRLARQRLASGPEPCVYLPMEGSAPYRGAVQSLVFGGEAPILQAGRVATVQSVGGSGALKVGSDVLRQLFPRSSVRVSNPTWDNHRAIFEGSGFAVGVYPYFDESTGTVDFNALLECLQALPAQTILVLHPCCHNPTGADLSMRQWDEVVSLVVARQLIPFLDMAYQGLGQSLDEDCYLARALVRAGSSFLLATSFSKTFSLYGERCGSLSMVCADAPEAARALGQMQQAVRRNYSSPPVGGARVVETILLDPPLRQLWESEVRGMRERIQAMRVLLHDKLAALGPRRDWGFLLTQRGMFSYAPALAARVDELRDRHAVYMVATGRLCMAGLNPGNVDRVALALSAC